MKDINSSLILNKIVFDKIEFERKGFQNENEISFEVEVQIGVNKENMYKVTLVLKGTKEAEYDFVISLSGFFTFETSGDLTENQKQSLINTNAVAILMPYLRSEVSLLTAQPNMDCVVLPVFNINKMLEENEQELENSPAVMCGAVFFPHLGVDLDF